MTINDLLMRFSGNRGPVFAADGEGGGAPSDGGGAVPTGAEPVGAADEIDPDVDLGLDTGEPTQDPEWEDLDFEDFKIKAPKGLAQRVADGTMRMSDYTKKTQEAAEIKRTYEASQKSLQERGEIDKKLDRGGYELERVDNWLKSEYTFFQSPEYAQLRQDNFFAADERWQKYQMNLQARGDLVGTLQGLMNERNSKIADAQKAAEAEASKRREQLPREIAKLVPGWNADMAGKVKDFGVSLGYAPEALDSSTDPLHHKTLHLAMIGQKYLDTIARKGGGATQVKPAQPTNVVRTRGGGNNTAPTDRDDTATWMRKENQRLADQRKARAG